MTEYTSQRLATTSTRADEESSNLDVELPWEASGSRSQSNVRQNPDAITARTLGGSFWMFLSTGTQAVLQIVVLSVLARLLAPADFGLVAAALVVVGFSAIFSQLGIGPAVVQREDLRTTHVRTGFTITLFFAVLLAGLIWLCAPAIAGFFRLEGLTSVERALSLVFPLQGLSVVAESLLQRSLRFRCLAIAELISVVLSFGVIGIVLALLGFGVWALVGAHIAQSVFKTTVLLVARPHPMLPQLNPKASAELMYFGGGFTAARLGNHLAGCVDNLVIGRWLGADALGVYGRAYQLVTGPAALFGGVLDRVLFPVMARLQSYPDRLATAFRCGVALVAFAVLPLSTLAFFLAPELIRVVLGPQWDHAVLPFQILTLGLTFRTSYKLSDSLVRATGAVYRRAWRQFAHAAFVFFGALVGQNWGLSGAAVGVLVAIAVNFLLMAHLSLNLVQLTWRSFCEAHFPALALAAFVGTQVWASAHILRAHEVAPVLVLILSTAAPMPSLLLVWCFPRVFLGREGLWLFRTLAAYRTP